MEYKKQKNERPTCACGRVDLYKEWLKQNDNEKEEVLLSVSKPDNQISYSDAAGNGNTKADPTKK
jgi:hypothetical protein